jgi:hypothetical protein
VLLLLLPSPLVCAPALAGPWPLVLACAWALLLLVRVWALALAQALGRDPGQACQPVAQRQLQLTVAVTVTVTQKLRNMAQHQAQRLTGQKLVGSVSTCNSRSSCACGQRRGLGSSRSTCSQDAHADTHMLV